MKGVIYARYSSDGQHEESIEGQIRVNTAFAEEKGIENLLNAIQMGIFTPSTKQRLEDLEQQHKDLTLQIAKEELAQPTLTRDQILFWLYRFRELNPEKNRTSPSLDQQFC